jgi:hypothetical protein
MPDPRPDSEIRINAGIKDIITHIKVGRNGELTIHQIDRGG